MTRGDSLDLRGEALVVEVTAPREVGREQGKPLIRPPVDCQVRLGWQHCEGFQGVRRATLARFPEGSSEQTSQGYLRCRRDMHSMRGRSASRQCSQGSAETRV